MHEPTSLLLLICGVCSIALSCLLLEVSLAFAFLFSSALCILAVSFEIKSIGRMIWLGFHFPVGWCLDGRISVFVAEALVR